MDNDGVIDFYDDYVSHQKATGINERLYSLYKRCKQLGLNTHSNFLELGCGIGSFTRLLARSVKMGNVEAVDISPKSIEYAQKNIRAVNIKFSDADILQYTPSLQQIDFISLFDVIEHIPLVKHHFLFRQLSSISDDHTKILINIPNPCYIEYLQKTNPEGLQVIDQAVWLSNIVNNADQNGLQVDFFETYSIWVQNDFQFFVISKKKQFTEVKLSDKKTIAQKAIKKIEMTYVKKRYD